MSAADRKITERVRRLLAMAADTSSPEEAAIAARRAAALMEKHNLEHADVLLRQGMGDRMAEQRASRSFRRPPRWYNSLAVPVAHLYDCEVRLEIDEYSGRWEHEFVGLDDDALVASYVLNYLAAEIDRLAARYRANRGADRRATYDFRLGAAHEIVVMLRDMERDKRGRETEGDGTSRALVLAKRELIRERYDIRYDSTSYRFRDSGHYSAGRAAGAGVRIRRAVKEPAVGRLDG